MSYTYKVENNDFVLNTVKGGDLFELTDNVGQNVYVTFLTWYSSWFYSNNFGIDYENFTNLNNGKGLLQASLKKTILSISGVTDIIQFTDDTSHLNEGIYIFTCQFTTSTDRDSLYTLSSSPQGKKELTRTKAPLGFKYGKYRKYASVIRLGGSKKR